MKKQLTVIFALLCFGCAQAAVHKPVGAKSLYVRLGKLDAIKAVINLSVDRILKDPRVKDYFVHADEAALRRHFIQLACAGTGGPCKYEGRAMKATHEGMLITNAAFDAVLEDILYTLRKLKVGSDEQAELMQLLNGMRKDVVELKG